MIDVLVIGAGPAGCHTAALLAQSGYDVHVLEEHPVVGEPVDCSGIIGAEAFDELEVADRLRLGEINSIEFVSPAGYRFDLALDSPLAYIVDRSAFDRAIAADAGESGAKIHTAARVLDLNLGEGYVEATVQRIESTVSSHCGYDQKSTVNGQESTVNSQSSNGQKLIVNCQWTRGTTLDELRLTNNLLASHPTIDQLPLTINHGGVVVGIGSQALDELRLTNNVRVPRPAIDQLLMIDNQQPEKVRARVAILAGGPKYKLQHKLGMGKPKEFLKTAQVELPLRMPVGAKIFLGSGVAPGSFGWLAPFKRGCKEHARIGVSAKMAAAPFLRRRIADLESQGLLDCTETPIRSWVIPASPIKRTYAERVLAVGDAAGQTKPTTGGGIYYGILGAKAAAKTVAEAFEKGDFSAGFLSRYEKEWKKSIGGEVRRGAFFRRLFERLSDKDIDDLFRVVLSDGVLSSLTKTARFDWHRDAINFILRHPELGKIFLRGLFR